MNVISVVLSPSSNYTTKVSQPDLPEFVDMKTMHSKAIVSSKGQVVIPRKVREMLGIRAGRELSLNVRQDGVIEMKPVTRTIDMLFGCCKRKGEKAMSIEEMDEAIAQAVMENDNYD